jgi:anti-sigma regulatory factor (Ser/Thr protein kinase)
MSLKQTKNIILEQSSVGLFSKKEAAGLIASGCAHVHSSMVGIKDPLVKLTYEGLDSKSLVNYPWEIVNDASKTFVTNSKDRKWIIKEILSLLKVKTASAMEDRIWTSLEELLTNSLFHAYHNPDGTEKYKRKENVELLPEERILLTFQRGAQGIFLSVKDSGRGLPLNKIQTSFDRCYKVTNLSQVETKEGGAGLGLYVVFELTTHLKIVSHSNSGTEINCWFANPSAAASDYFSFNYFEGVK